MYRIPLGLMEFLILVFESHTNIYKQCQCHETCKRWFCRPLNLYLLLLFPFLLFQGNVNILGSGLKFHKKQTSWISDITVKVSKLKWMHSASSSLFQQNILIGFLTASLEDNCDRPMIYNFARYSDIFVYNINLI